MVKDMKKSAQIKGLPIINISQGQEIGKVKSLVINPEKGSIDFITIEHEDWQVSVKAIPFRKVVGIGEYAVTIEADNAVIDLNEIPIANELVNKKIKIIDTKVMTRKGELLGTVNEYYADKENGQIIAMDLIIDEEKVVLPHEHVLTYGKDITVVKEDALTGLLDSIEDLLTESQQPAGENTGLFIEDTVVEADVSTVEDVAPSVTTEEVALKDKQIDLLVGKMVRKDIFDRSGKLFVKEGTVLTEEHIKQAQNIGFDLVIQLSMSVEV